MGGLCPNPVLPTTHPKLPVHPRTGCSPLLCTQWGRRGGRADPGTCPPATTPLTQGLHHAALPGVRLGRHAALEAVHGDDALPAPPNLQDAPHLGAALRGDGGTVTTTPCPPPWPRAPLPGTIPSPSHLPRPCPVLAQSLGEVAVGPGARPLAHVEDGFDEGPEALRWAQAVAAQRQVLGDPGGANPNLWGLCGHRGGAPAPEPPEPRSPALPGVEEEVVEAGFQQPLAPVPAPVRAVELLRQHPLVLGAVGDVAGLQRGRQLGAVPWGGHGGVGEHPETPPSGLERRGGAPQDSPSGLRLSFSRRRR